MSLQKLKRERAVLKTRITVALIALTSLKDPGELSLDVFEEVHASAKERMEAVERVNCTIIDVMIGQEVSEEDLEAKMMGQEVVRFTAQVKLCTSCPASSAEGEMFAVSVSTSVAKRQNAFAVQTFHTKPLQMKLPSFLTMTKMVLHSRIFWCTSRLQLAVTLAFLMSKR
jgi:hypothetical protein